MSLFIEAGIFGAAAFLVFLAGLIAVLRQRKSAAARAAIFAVAIVACGAVGAGMGQRLVDRALHQEPELRRQVTLLSAGTREAAANELLAGMFALALLGIGGAVQLANRDDD